MGDLGVLPEVQPGLLDAGGRRPSLGEKGLLL